MLFSILQSRTKKGLLVQNSENKLRLECRLYCVFRKVWNKCHFLMSTQPKLQKFVATDIFHYIWIVYFFKLKTNAKGKISSTSRNVTIRSNDYGTILLNSTSIRLGTTPTVRRSSRRTANSTKPAISPATISVRTALVKSQQNSPTCNFPIRKFLPESRWSDNAAPF